MFSKLINNIPNIENKKNHKFNYLEKFDNLGKTVKIDSFEDFVYPDTNIDEHHNHVDLPEKEQEIILDQEENQFGEKYFAMLTGKKTKKVDQVPKLENIENIDEDKKKIDKKYKLDTLTTVYIGSISIIALYIAYRAIRKTI